MTSDNQNKDYHWTNMNFVMNRVSGLPLADDEPICQLSDLPNGAVLPQAKDNLNNRENYIVLVGRIIRECIPALNFFKHAVQKHIHHKYSEEMAQCSSKVINGLLQISAKSCGRTLSSCVGPAWNNNIVEHNSSGPSCNLALDTIRVNRPIIVNNNNNIIIFIIILFIYYYYFFIIKCLKTWN